MPVFLIGGAIGAVVGAITGFTASGGAKATSNGIKYAVLGVGAIFAAKQMGWIK